MLGLSVASVFRQPSRLLLPGAVFVSTRRFTASDAGLPKSGRSLQLDTAFRSLATTHRYRLAAARSPLLAYIFAARFELVLIRWQSAHSLVRGWSPLTTRYPDPSEPS